MLDESVTVERADAPGEAVVIGVGLAIVEKKDGPHAVEGGLAKEGGAVEGVVPLGEIENVEVEGAVGSGVEGGRDPGLVLEMAVLAEFVAGSAIGNDVGFGDEAGGGHAERTEDALLEEVGVEDAGDFVNDDAEKNVVGVAVVPLFADGKFDGQRVHFFDQLIFSEIEAEVEGAVGAGAGVVFVFGEAGGVREEIFDFDGLPGFGGVGEIFGDAVVEGEFVFFDKHHDGSGNELFADGAGLEDGFGFDGDVEFDVAETVALGEKDFAAGIDADLEAGDVLAGHFGGDVTVDGGDLVGGEVGEGGGKEMRGNGDRCKEKNEETESDDFAHGSPFRMR